PVFVQKNSVIFRQNQYGQLFYIVLDAEVESTRTAPKKTKSRKSRRLVLRTVNDVIDQRTLTFGSTLAEETVLMNTTHDSTAVVTQKGFLLAVHRLHFRTAQQEHNSNLALEDKARKFKAMDIFETLDDDIVDALFQATQF